ncbi:hypothetical protein [Ornithinimicrobium murale]|uniref:hypothetical protein n=1 Tax=Ornithinimicrobium murale TaxID=1050153 RepID=UPI000E0D8D6D|nr:hypothetical protein [Ornithinimicrobium murale]
MDDTTPLAIDPRGCGCTECLVGEYIPAQSATREHLRLVATGRMRNNTYSDGTVTLRPPMSSEPGSDLVYEIALLAESLSGVFTADELDDTPAEAIFENLRA